MKRIIISISFLTGLLLFGLVNHFAVTDKPKTGYRIAIFEPAIHPAMDEIAQGFIDTLAQSHYQYSFKRFNANGNKILMQAEAEEIVLADFDLIFTIGTGCSLTIKELCAKKEYATPVVFCGIDDPKRLNIFGPTITGVTELIDYQEQVRLLTELMPGIKRLLLVYDPTQGSGLEQEKNTLRSLLQEKSINLVAVEIRNITEVQQKITGLMPTSDTLMILKDHTAVSGIDSLITLCQRYHKPLIACDLNSGAKGAVLAYGIREYDSGVGGAHKAQLILEHHKKPCDIPVTAVENQKMVINSAQTVAQGLIFDRSKIQKFTNIEIK